MRLFLRALWVLLLSAPFIVLVLALQSRPEVSSPAPLSPEAIAEVQQILLDNVPEAPDQPGTYRLQLSESELNLLLRYGIELLDLHPAWAASLRLEQEALFSSASVPAFSLGATFYFNVAARFSASDGALLLEELRVGDLQLPRALLGFAMDRARRNLLASEVMYEDVEAMLANIDELAIDRESMGLSLQWDPALVGRITTETQQLFISAEDKRRIIDYYQIINAIATTIPTDVRAVSLNQFLVPLFAAARERSQQGGEAVAENRAALQALAVYVNNESITRLVGAELASEVPAAKFVEVRLLRRQDLAQHLASIAAITASAGANFAQLLSTTKEAYDARYRSGFSFSDLTANSVGVSMASLCTDSEETARLMQERIAQMQMESDYMPEVGNNRDGISESDFYKLYSDRNSPEYRQRLSEIDDLIRARPLFAGLR